MSGTFVLRRVKSGLYSFVLKAANGHTLMTSDVFTTKSEALRALDMVRQLSPSAEVASGAPADTLAPFLGQWVAMVGDDVVDHDAEPGVLYERLRAKGIKNDRFFRVGQATRSLSNTG